jgi:hypothetical protein
MNPITFKSSRFYISRQEDPRFPSGLSNGKANEKYSDYLDFVPAGIYF